MTDHQIFVQIYFARSSMQTSFIYLYWFDCDPRKIQNIGQMDKQWNITVKKVVVFNYNYNKIVKGLNPGVISKVGCV